MLASVITHMYKNMKAVYCCFFFNSENWKKPESIEEWINYGTSNRVFKNRTVCLGIRDMHEIWFFKKSMAQYDMTSFYIKKFKMHMYTRRKVCKLPCISGDYFLGIQLHSNFVF